MIKGHQGRNQRSLSLITFLISVFIIAYHGALCLMLKRISMEPTLELACSIYDKNQDFLGETDIFFRLEFLIFFAQIIAMPFCVIRMKIGKLIEIDDVHFQ